MPAGGTRPSSIHQMSGTDLLTRKSAGATGTTSSTRGQTPEGRGTTVRQPAERRPHTNTVRQNEMIEEYVAMEGAK